MYLSYFSARVASQVHRASTKGKLHKRSFTPSVMADQAVKHSCLAAFWQVAFKFTPTQALPRCLSNMINTSLRSKEKPSRRNLTCCFYLWFVLVCSITHYGKCPCMDKLSPITLSWLGWLPNFPARTDVCSYRSLHGSICAKSWIIVSVHPYEPH